MTGFNEGLFQACALVAQLLRALVRRCSARNHQAIHPAAGQAGRLKPAAGWRRLPLQPIGAALPPGRKRPTQMDGAPRAIRVVVCSVLAGVEETPFALVIDGCGLPCANRG